MSDQFYRAGVRSVTAFLAGGLPSYPRPDWGGQSSGFADKTPGRHEPQSQQNLGSDEGFCIYEKTVDFESESVLS